MICINEVKKEGMWIVCESWICEIEEYTYLGVTVKAGLICGFNCTWDIMVHANGVIGTVKDAATRSGSRYVVDREGWKSMVVNKLMYGCDALAWMWWFRSEAEWNG